jgi:hypothetical protein
MVDLIFVCSVTTQECFEVYLKQTLERVGVPYKLILTDPNMSITKSYNSILQTNMNDVKESKYLVFVSQDIRTKKEDWGKDIVSICDSLPDFGLAGIECKRCAEEVGYVHNRQTDIPICEVTCCDGAFIIIPSKLFIEHQFDTQFEWYPFMEDYQCWIHIIKHLKVYHIPIKGYETGYHVPSRHVSQYKNQSEYARSLERDHDRLLKKWGLKELKTTTWG